MNDLKNSVIVFLVLMFALISSNAYHHINYLHLNSKYDALTQKYDEEIVRNNELAASIKRYEDLTESHYLMRLKYESKIKKLEKYSEYVFCNLVDGNADVKMYGIKYHRSIFEVYINEELIKSPPMVMDCSGLNEYEED